MCQKWNLRVKSEVKKVMRNSELKAKFENMTQVAFGGEINLKFTFILHHRYITAVRFTFQIFSHYFSSQAYKQ